MTKFHFLSFVIICFGLTHGFSQTITRIGDINPAGASSHFSPEFSAIVFEEKILFTANNGTLGQELWIYDGESVSLVKDIYPGPKNSNPQHYYQLGDKVVFVATDSLHGPEWWVTDGTTEGTELVKDIFPGPGGGVSIFGTPERRYIGRWNDHIYFAGASVQGDYELWKTNGTAAGTVLVKNILSGTFPSYPSHFAEHNGALYFSCRDGLWKTNGTTAGTVLVQNKDPEDVFGLEPYDLISNGDYLLFFQNDRLWRSDGTTAGTVKIKNLSFVNLNWFGHRCTRLDSIILFPGNDGTHGEELWRSNGTPEGTYMVIDLDEGPDGYAPQNNIFFQDKMYYKGDDGQTGIELWSSDGTAEGTTLIKELDPGFSSGFYLPSLIYTDGNRIYMSAGPSFEKELYVSDGTTEGTYLLDINASGESHPTTFLAYGDQLFLFAFTPEYGHEPHIIDFTTSTTGDDNRMALNVHPNPTTGLVQISGDDVMEHTLYDLKGNMLFHATGNSQIDLSPLPEGLYILKSVDPSNRKAAFSKIVRTK